MKTIKESKDISSFEARVIQYSKIFLAVAFGSVLIYYLHSINSNLIRQNYVEEKIFDKVDSVNITLA